MIRYVIILFFFMINSCYADSFYGAYCISSDNSWGASSRMIDANSAITQAKLNLIGYGCDYSNKFVICSKTSSIKEANTKKGCDYSVIFTKCSALVESISPNGNTVLVWNYNSESQFLAEINALTSCRNRGNTNCHVINSICAR